MYHVKLRKTNRERRKLLIRSRVSGNAEKPRFTIFRSNKYIYAQLVDDDSAVTLASAQGKDASKVGTEIAKKAVAKKIKKVVFDRGGYIYTGKVSKLAESARKGGLNF